MTTDYPTRTSLRCQAHWQNAQRQPYIQILPKSLPAHPTQTHGQKDIVANLTDNITKDKNSQPLTAITKDGGMTWRLVSNGKNPGYRSCVQYLPDSGGQELVAVWSEGIDYSPDGGKTWENLSREGFYTIRFVNDSLAFAAGKGRISKLVFRRD